MPMHPSLNSEKAKLREKKKEKQQEFESLQDGHASNDSGAQNTPSSSLQRHSSTLGGRGSRRRRTTLRLTLTSRLIGIASSRGSRESSSSEIGIVAASGGLLIGNIGRKLDIGALRRTELVPQPKKHSTQGTEYVQRKDHQRDHHSSEPEG